MWRLTFPYTLPELEMGVGMPTKRTELRTDFLDFLIANIGDAMLYQKCKRKEVGGLALTHRSIC